ncbi:pentatricopeptide repeat-containing protein At2g37310 [Phalaenopsis equestris]|uniref:pentatricopeptide repeat-containing protein At2g37310 n=1 Tax=Phalaenopsis equestris TaxID=78828 RepID=UPI0009E2802E|nr:pentatricopeptide repeat-containing protein At2g37310 [Phalaenopsis equestris]
MRAAPVAAAVAAASTRAAASASSLRLAKLQVADSRASPEVLSFGLLIQHFSDCGLFLHGRQLHARLVLLSVIPDNFLGSKLISLYSRSGNLYDARLIFDAIPIKNLFSWNAMLLAYSFHGQTASFFRLFCSIPTSLRPDAFTLSSLLKSISSQTSVTATKEVHSFSLRLGYDSDLFVSNGLITVYLRSGDISSARKLFDKMPERDVVSWNSIICGYAQEGHYAACIELYQDMKMGVDRVMPNGVTVASVLLACSQLKNLLFGMEVHRFALESGMGMDFVVCNSIIGLYARCGSLDYARSLFNCMVEKDEVTYNTMISGYMSYGFVDQAMKLFHLMPAPVLSTWNAVIGGLVQNNCFSHILDLFQAMQTAGFRPNSVTIASVLPAVSCHSNLLRVKQIHCYAIKNDFDQNLYVSTSLIDAYGKAGFLEGANSVFERTASRSVIVWTAIISACAIRGDADAALAFFGRMLQVRMQPDSVTFTAVLSACAHGGEVKEAHSILHVLMPECGISPAVEHYACMVGALSRKGMLTEAVELIDRMPVKPNGKVWGALLNGASVYRDVELGEYAFGRLFEIEPGNTGNFILMANLYSQAGKWKEAEKVRERMKGVGLAKIPGCSWIEGSGGMQVFITRDVNNEHSEEIFFLLDALVGMMREEGYLTKEELDEESCCQ